jgi:hypothetical protein
MDFGDGLSASAGEAAAGRHIDLSQAYPARIGDWDKVAINYGYSQLPQGGRSGRRWRASSTKPGRKDLRYLTNQDRTRIRAWISGRTA